VSKTRTRVLKATEGRLVGRTIRAVDFGAFDNGRGGTTTTPVITLDNGDRLSFTVRETESLAYGVEIDVHTERPTGQERNLDQLCAALDVAGAVRNDEDYCRLIVAVRRALSARHRTQLLQLVDHGPVSDAGIISSKLVVDDLIRWKLAVGVIVKGNWSYTTATFRGGHVIGDRAARAAQEDTRG
jgi:hypothetical protein